MIVVTPNTLVSKLVYDWIAGYELEQEGEVRHIPGKLPLFSNVVNDQPVAVPRTIVVDSKQLESGEGMKADFKKAAAEEIEAFKLAYRKSNPGADVSKLDDTDLLREVMNTVGKKGQARCRRALRGLSGDAHRGMGCQHSHPHSRREGIWLAATL